MAALFIVVLWYAATDRKLGGWLASGAGRVLTILVYISFTLYVVALTKLSESNVLLLCCPVALYFLLIALAWVRREKWAGELVLDASVPRSATRILNAVAAVLGLTSALHGEVYHRILSLSMAVLSGVSSEFRRLPTQQQFQL